MGDIDPATKAIVKQVFAYLGLVFWSFQLCPQAWSNYRHGAVGVLSSPMMFCWAIWAPFFAGYGMGKPEGRFTVGLIVQPNLFCFFALVCFVQCLLYRRQARVITTQRATVLLALLCVVFGCLEFGMYLIVNWVGIQNPESGVLSALGLVPTVLIIGGFIPQYITICAQRQVDGISFLFLACDILGGIFSLVSLYFHDGPFDYISAGSYLGVIMLDLGIVVLHHWFVRHPSRSSRKTASLDDTL
ncbi:uncharacterized protein BJ171DRAFT_491888 [Polychytrium aggregatum]|uniref:uncharacterized protein n=1 Tax=Polychytrium aggregatum TaxID=110093 RepID=UPI0022FED546|nr:uncharacterized protein BJ171DRAFT_491888 [Polychytrium aggregatum]KAI9207878.1 hypothetical protein BJ171DRAFT_491888 [Polychytrium aggregatum]